MCEVQIKVTYAKSGSATRVEVTTPIDYMIGGDGDEVATALLGPCEWKRDGCTVTYRPLDDGWRKVEVK
jgi:hypothetical protein